MSVDNITVADVTTFLTNISTTVQEAGSGSSNSTQVQFNTNMTSNNNSSMVFSNGTIISNSSVEQSVLTSAVENTINTLIPIQSQSTSFVQKAFQIVSISLFYSTFDTFGFFSLWATFSCTYLFLNVLYFAILAVGIWAGKKAEKKTNSSSNKQQPRSSLSETSSGSGSLKFDEADDVMEELKIINQGNQKRRIFKVFFNWFHACR